jgi:hypothetical protein
MVALNKIDSNATGLAYAREASLGVLPTTPVWIPLEPNSYGDFGGEITTVARNPINLGRQRKKGVITDNDANGDFETDLTQTNMQDLLQVFMFAAARTKDDLAVATTTATTFNVGGGGTGYRANDLVFGKGFAQALNNRVHVVASATASTITTGATAAIDTTGQITRVGHQFATGDLAVNVAGTWPALTSTTKNLTELGLIPGEWIWVGGDLAAEQFANAANNGMACVKSVAANRIEFHKTRATWVADAGTGKTIRLYFGRVIKNEVGPLIVRQSLQFERQLGAPDDAFPTNIQSEYLVGSVANELEMTINTADKITMSLGFVAQNNEQRTATENIKSGTRPALVEGDAYNTSTDIKRIRLSSYVTGQTAPAPLFAFLQDVSVTINNNVTPNKAVGVIGAFELTAGTFEVSASLNAYFASIEAARLVRQNADTTLDIFAARANAGYAIDFPMLTLGDGRLSVEQDEPITLPLTCDAGTGAKFDPNMNHTLLMVFFDYLPNAAMA